MGKFISQKPNPMAATAEKKYITQQTYLELERKASHKSEYHEGEIFAMAGASFAHNQIVGNVIGELKLRLKTSPCDIFPSDLRLHIPSEGFYTYPDMMVICGNPEFTDDKTDTVKNPTVILEVLSPSTANYDLGTKFGFYRSIKSLQYYLAVSSEEQKVISHSKTEPGRWLVQDVKDGSIQLPELELALPFEEVYRDVALS